MGTKQSTPVAESIPVHIIRVLLIKKIFETSRNKELCKILGEEIPHVSNLIAEKYLMSFDGWNLSSVHSALWRSYMTIATHIQVGKLNDKCKIGLTQKQWDMLLQIYAECSLGEEETRKVIIDRKLHIAKMEYEKIIREKYQEVNAMTTEQCLEELELNKLDGLETITCKF
jgi:hypothetical protein